MHFVKGYLYHIYNQGNNQQKIFFNRENYLFFLRKINTHILPYTDILAWCLMPNHFHLMVLVREVELQADSEAFARREGFGGQAKNTANKTEGFSGSEAFGGQTAKYRTINNSIGIMLRSYTDAINKKQNRIGALFHRKTKAECINSPNSITPSFITEAGITKINIKNSEQQYPQICFDYIHQNPVKANLVKITADWEFSSALDYAGIRKGKIINKTVAKEYIDFSL